MSFKARIKRVSLIFACGTALFSDGYANVVIGSVNTLLTRIYGKEALAHHNYSTVVNSVGFAGFVVGMLLFGYLSDKIGRKFGMMAASTIILVFSGLAAASSGAKGSVGGLLSMLSAMRFFLGIGLGAEYPCGSVSASEQSEEPGINKRAWHRWLILSTNTMICSGFVMASFVPLVLFWIFGPNHLNAVWRLSLGLGMVPAAAVFLWRLNMDEPAVLEAVSYDFVYMLDILSLVRYPFNLYSSTIINNITGGSTNLSVVFGWNVVINLFYMPGTVLGALVVDYLGPKYTLIVGLIAQALITFFMSGFYTKLTEHIAAFAVVYGLFYSSLVFGQGNCTFILASKSCPTAVRGQFFGVAAAAGKLGAFVGTWIFPPIIQAFGGPSTVRGNTGPFWIGGALALFSAVITFFFIQPLTPGGIVQEDIEFRAYLEAHGYDTSKMGLVGAHEADSDPGLPSLRTHDTHESRASSEKATMA